MVRTLHLVKSSVTVARVKYVTRKLKMNNLAASNITTEKRNREDTDKETIFADKYPMRTPIRKT